MREQRGCGQERGQECGCLLGFTSAGVMVMRTSRAQNDAMSHVTRGELADRIGGVTPRSAMRGKGGGFGWNAEIVRIHPRRHAINCVVGFKVPDYRLARLEVGVSEERHAD